MSRLALAAALLALVPAIAFAHANLTTATPATGSTVKTAPAEVAIGFTAGVEPSLSSIEVLDPLGTHMEDGPARTAPGDDKRLLVPVKLLQPGTYTVQWRATALDRHETTGSYQFTVAFSVGG